MQFIAKIFTELTAAQIYEILKSRSEIFMLEQNIRCLDMDDVDYNCHHCFFEENGRVSAYLRAFYYDEDKKVVKIGRVLTLTHGQGHGSELMHRSIAEIKEKLPCEKLYVEAQVQARGFYEKMGFVAVSDEFIEEGIPHVAMEMYL